MSIEFAWGLLAVVVVAFFGERRLLKWLRNRDSDGGVWGTIEGYVGRPGQGKTTRAVQHAIGRAIAISGSGRSVLLASNITVRPPEPILAERLPTGPDGFDVLYLVRLALAQRAQGGGLVLLIDEAGICMPARMWRLYGPVLMWLFQQSRKLYVEVVWTAQSETFVDAQLRELTAATHYVTASPAATVARRLRGERPKKIEAATYDRTAVGKEDAYLGSSSWRYKLAWEASYDTDDFVMPPAKLEGADALIALVEEFLLAERGAEPPVLEALDGPGRPVTGSAGRSAA